MEKQDHGPVLAIFLLSHEIPDNIIIALKKEILGEFNLDKKAVICSLVRMREQKWTEIVGRILKSDVKHLVQFQIKYE